MKVKSHNQENFKDAQSVSLLTNILTSHGRVMPDLKHIDKWPNIDGSLEFHDVNKNLLGKFEAQVKTLPRNHNFKINCPLTFIEYCKLVPTIPVFLLGVDNSESKIYWLLIDDSFINNLNINNNKTSKQIQLNNNKFISKDNRDYIQDWERILIINKDKYRDFIENKKFYDSIKQNVNILTGDSKPFFPQIHAFLDELNFYLDNKLEKIKEIFFKNAWKIGIAYNEFTDISLGFSLYPINYDKNDIQIMEVDKTYYKQLNLKNYTTWFYGKENPILSDHKNLAIKLLSDYGDKLLENKLLNYNEEFLALEFIFAFIEEFKTPLGLNIRNEYGIEEIEEAFFKYLPIWTEEANNLLFSKHKYTNHELIKMTKISNLAVLDPGRMNSNISPDEQSEIEEKVKYRIKINNLASPFYLINDKFPIGIFIELIGYLKNKKFKILKRFYRPKNYNRLTELKSNWIWHVYNYEDFKYNIELFFEKLPCVYDELINKNFPNLLNELSLFGESDKIIVKVSFTEDIKSHFDHPTCEMFYLKSKNNINKQKTIDVYINDNDIKLEKESEEVEYEGSIYTLEYWRWMVLDYIYEDTPMFNYIQRELKDKLQKYLKK